MVTSFLLHTPSLLLLWQGLSLTTYTSSMACQTLLFQTVIRSLQATSGKSSSNLSMFLST
uniref:Uncharacterized protein n=1 Tax=Setaria viridis TaxID=4556 RepID=A0A4U6VJX3_SETVI|nr:hypothetical protein SEVIR_3G283975v2 [Setaria viridis]